MIGDKVLNALSGTNPFLEKNPLYGDKLSAHAELPWVNRILNPAGHGAIVGADGQKETHRLSAELDAQGNAWVFPTIVENPDGTLRRLPTYDALNFALKNNTAMPFNDIWSAAEFTRNYKPKSFLDFYEK
jgi:hypothetical protein